MEEHERLMEAMRARDAERVQNVWRQHLQHAGRDTCRVLHEHQMAIAAEAKRTA